MKLTNKKVLVAFFSHTGENYSNGDIVDLSKGNTHVAAEMIRDFCDFQTGGEPCLCQCGHF